MTKEQFDRIINRYLNGESTPKETQMVEEFYEKIQKDGMTPANWNEIRKSLLKDRMYQKIEKRVQHRKGPYLTILSVAAAVLLLVGGYFFLNRTVPTSSQSVSTPVLQTIVAGKEQRSVLLSDGSYVLLYPGASLTFPVQFEGGFRKVSLSGEAWFDVFEDPIHPFQVLANDVTTTVLGTTFSINANRDNSKVDVKVTSGKVKVSARDRDLAVLEMDDHLLYEAGEFTILPQPLTPVNTEKIHEPGNWKLANVSMAEAVEFLEKRWNKNFTFENPIIRDCQLYASFNAEDPFEEVMMIITTISNSKFDVEDDEITIYGDGCHGALREQ